MKVTSLRYLDAKFHHPSLGASPPNRGKSICLPPELSLLLKRRSINKFRHRYSMLWPTVGYPSTSWASCYNNSSHLTHLKNDAQLRIATVTRFSWYFSPNTTGLIKNIEHMLSLKFYLKYRAFDRVMSKYRRVRFFETQIVKSLLLLWKPRSWF